MFSQLKKNCHNQNIFLFPYWSFDISSSHQILQEVMTLRLNLCSTDTFLPILIPTSIPSLGFIPIPILLKSPHQYQYKTSYRYHNDTTTQAGISPAKPQTLFVGNSQSPRKSLRIWDKCLKSLMNIVFKVHFKVCKLKIYTIILDLQMFPG